MSDPDGPALLVVDDNEDNRYTLARRLKREGYAKVAVAENGRQALDMLDRERFDLVLLDIMMPEMNGYQVLEHIKSSQDLREIRVIMISAVDELDSVVRCIELGADDYLPKPFNAVLLKARVGACLEKKRLRDQQAAYLSEIDRERQRADDLLHAILPAAAVRELKETNAVAPRRFEDVAVLFCDVVDFTPYCEKHSPEEAVGQLQGQVRPRARVGDDRADGELAERPRPCAASNNLLCRDRLVPDVLQREILEQVGRPRRIEEVAGQHRVPIQALQGDTVAGQHLHRELEVVTDFEDRGIFEHGLEPLQRLCRV